MTTRRAYEKAIFLDRYLARRTGRGDDHGLCVEELAHTGSGELAAIAGVLDSAEGEARGAGDHGIEEDCPALEPGDEALLVRRVASPGGGAADGGGIVGEADG